MAYKRELIVNNGQSLTSYKKLLKVSDVCQLLDKSKYPATQTINGVTFTNNGDGTITVNGTATSSIYFDIITDWLKLSTDKKYLIIGCPSGGRNDTYFLYVNNGGALWSYDTGNGSIGTPIKINAIVTICITVGTTANNLVFKPQLFDLTEMYGAGNEPATVAEFKAKFPNDLYDYSPRCWVTSYKTGLIAKTKNLFDVNGVTALFQFVNEVDYPFVYDGKFITIATDGIVASGSVVLKLPVHLLSGEYTFSFISGTDWVDSPDKGVSIVVRKLPLENSSSIIKGVKITQSEQKCSITITVDEESDWYFGCLTAEKGSIICWDIQIEQGSTATDYVPYGYL